MFGVSSIQKDYWEMFMPSGGSLSFGSSYYGSGTNLFSSSGWNQMSYSLRLQNMTDWTNIANTSITSLDVFEVQ
jgi:hypothetical protein